MIFVHRQDALHILRKPLERRQRLDPLGLPFRDKSNARIAGHTDLSGTTR